MTEKKPKLSPKRDLTNLEVLRIYNNHSADCGKPQPRTNRDDTTSLRKPYYGYYENQYGEQFVFMYVFADEEGFVWSGDCGWKSKLPVVEIKLDDMIAQAKKDLPDRSAEEHKAFLLGDHPIPSAHRLKNGNYLYPGGMLFNQQEMAWLKSCWETVCYHKESRKNVDAKRAEKEGEK